MVVTVKFVFETDGEVEFEADLMDKFDCVNAALVYSSVCIYNLSMCSLDYMMSWA